MKKGTFLMGAGLLLILAALFLTGYNIWDDSRAGREAQELVLKMEEEIGGNDSESEGIPDYISNPDMEMPVIEINGQRYIGQLEIPKLGLTLPIMDSWSYPKLRIAPCRYQGSAYKNDLIIAGHNYQRHFGQLKTLVSGDQMIFMDVEGHLFVYEVTEMEVLAPTAVEAMQSGDWDLTLFTCTYGGQSRVTLRCKKIVNGSKLGYNNKE